jgi:hypothetical protein
MVKSQAVVDQGMLDESAFQAVAPGSIPGSTEMSISLMVKQRNTLRSIS